MTRLELLNYNLDMMLEHDDYDPYQENALGTFVKNAAAFITGATLGAAMAKGLMRYKKAHPKLYNAAIKKEKQIWSHPESKTFLKEFGQAFARNDKKTARELVKRHGTWLVKEYRQIPGVERVPGLSGAMKQIHQDMLKKAIKQRLNK